MSNLLQPENVAFTTALVVMLGIAVLEGVATLLGMGMSSFIDNMLPDTPDVDVDLDMDVDMDIDMDADMDMDAGPAEIGHASALSSLLGWLTVGKVPALILLVVLLTVFGLGGLIVQGIIASIVGTPLTAWIVAPVMFAASLPVVRAFGLGFAKIIPKEETSAVTRDSFIGRVATITLGTASAGAPAQAKLVDQHGQAHYMMVEPDIDGETFSAGDKVLLVSGASSVFRVIAATGAVLKDG
jgi:hypothetical protein